MPSKSSHRAALRRFSEPQVIPPAGLNAMPIIREPAGFLPPDCGWRNPVIGEAYDRLKWEAYYVGGDCSHVVVRVELVPDRSFEVRCGEHFAKVADPVAAFALATEWARGALPKR